MGNPLVSVLIPNFNYAHFLTHSIESVLKQTYPHFELIICDNRSTDNSLAVIEPYLKDERVQIFVNEENLGMFGNFSRCAEHAQGDYLKWLCADDYLHSDFLLKLVPLMESHPRAVIGAAPANVLDQEGHLINQHKIPAESSSYYSSEEVLQMTLWHQNPIGNPTQVIIRADAYTEVGGYDLEISYCADYDLLLRLLNIGDLAYFHEVLAYKIAHDDNATISYAREGTVLVELERMYRKSFQSHPFFMKDKDRQFRVWSDAMNYYFRNAVRHALHGHFVELLTFFRLLIKQKQAIRLVGLYAGRLMQNVTSRAYQKYLGSTI